MVRSQEPVIRTSRRAFNNEKENAVDVRHTVCLRERHRGDTVVVSPEVGHSFCREIEPGTVQ